MLENVKSDYVTRIYKLQLGYRECLLPKKKKKSVMENT